MIVQHRRARLLNKCLASGAAGGGPDALHNCWRLLQRIPFVRQPQLTVTHHVEQHSPVNRRPAIVLRKRTRAEEHVGQALSIVLPIEQHNRHPLLRRMGLQGTRDLQQHSNSRGPVIGPQDRLLAVGRIGVTLCRRTRIPMCAEQNMALAVRIKGGGNVGQRQPLAAHLHPEPTHHRPIRPRAQLPAQPSGTPLVGRRPRNAVAKLALTDQIAIGSRGVERARLQARRCAGTGRASDR